MVLFYGLPVLADTIILKNGKTYSNVKAFPRQGAHRIQFYNRRAIIVPNKQIAKVRIRPINWPKRKAIRKFKPVQIPKKPDPRLPAVEGAPYPYLSHSHWNLAPVWKSTILPGWGQYSLGHKWRGAAFLGGSMLALSQYWQKRQLHTAAQEEYSEQLTPTLLATQGINGYVIFLGILEQEKSTLLKREQATNDMVTVLSLVWGWNVLDALILSNPRIIKEYPILEYLRFGIDTDHAGSHSQTSSKSGIQTMENPDRSGRLSLGLKFRF